MPQTQEVPQSPSDAILASLRGERRKLERIAASLKMQEQAERSWLVSAWQRLHERAVVYADREVELFGSVRGATESLLWWIQESLGDIDPPSVARLRAGNPHDRLWGIEEDEDEDWRVPDDPEAPPAPTPLVVIRPNSSPPNRYGGARAAHDPELAALDWAFGEDGAAREGVVMGWQARDRRTGRRPGRPPRGATDPATAEQLLLQRCESYTIDRLKTCLRRGRPAADAHEIRAVLQAAVADICSSGLATHAALASALGCGVRAIDRLAA